VPNDIIGFRGKNFHIEEASIMKKKLSLFLLLLLLSFPTVLPALAKEKVNFYLDGNPIIFKETPQIVNSMTYAPASEIFAQMGFIEEEANTNFTVYSGNVSSDCSLSEVFKKIKFYPVYTTNQQLFIHLQTAAALTGKNISYDASTSNFTLFPKKAEKPIRIVISNVPSEKFLLTYNKSECNLFLDASSESYSGISDFLQKLDTEFLSLYLIVTHPSQVTNLKSFLSNIHVSQIIENSQVYSLEAYQQKLSLLSYFYDPDTSKKTSKYDNLSKLEYSFHWKATPGSVAYLTFDDGPSLNTVKILDTLKKYNVKATFFVLGKNVEKYPQILKRIVNEGHAVGNHGYSHVYSNIYQSTDSLLEEVKITEEAIARISGIKPNLFRAPGGSNYRLDSEMRQALYSREYLIFDWNVSSLDSTSTAPPVDFIVSSVLKGVQGKKSAIILMHDANAKITSAQSVEQIIKGLQKMGYRLDKITENTTPCVQPLPKKSR
jgi:peptidoglycan/xylan/chitin deacetylase (PgdA/CDA1 family)